MGECSIVIDRKKSIWGCAVRWNVFDGSNYIGCLTNGQKIRAEVESGVHEIKFYRKMFPQSEVCDDSIVVYVDAEHPTANVYVQLKTDWKFKNKGYGMLFLTTDAIPVNECVEQKTKNKNLVQSPRITEKVMLEIVDSMEGNRFENWCAGLLRHSGFVNVYVTQSSGDQGVDIVAQKNEILYAIQCKRYVGNLGNTPIQEVYAGKEMYGCHVGVVLTNSYFTEAAKELAEKTRVLLWDRDVLTKMMRNAYEYSEWTFWD